MKHSVIIKNLMLLSLITTSVSPAWSHVNGKHTYRVEITMDQAARESLKARDKAEVSEANMKVYSEGELTDEEQVSISTRGQSSLKFARKNLSVKVLKEQDGEKKKIEIGEIKSKHLTMSASPEDLLFVKNSIGYSLLKAIGIHSLQTQFAEVKLNGVSQGLYMVTENQTDNLMKGQDSEIVIRRRYNDALEVKDAKEGLSEADILKYQQTLRSVHKSIREMHGEHLIATLEKNLNLKNYLKWLAFNYIVKNGDYSDEVYFFGKKNSAGEIYFDVSPWDMDDSFSEKMHLSGFLGGPNYRMTDESQKQLIYNYESRIDRKVAGDAKLLRMYFEAMDEVVSTLSQTDVLYNIQQNILADLMPYIDDADIQANGLLDSVQTRHSRSAIEDRVKIKMAKIKLRMQAIKEELEVIKTEENLNHRVLDLSVLRKVLIKIDNVLLRYFTK
ncbi:MAG: CotH kinase family protein [Bdellovibrionota bacterium]